MLPEDPAVVFVSTETDTEIFYSFAQLKAEVMRMAAIMRSLGFGKGDRVLIYLPMIPEASFAMLASGLFTRSFLVALLRVCWLHVSMMRRLL